MKIIGGLGLEIKDMQADVHKWISQFEEGYWHPLSMLARMTEEVGELAREINHHYGQKPKKATEEEGNLPLELGDIMFIVACMANSLNIDLEEAFKGTMDKYYKRDINRWTKKQDIE